jgi:pimeloyl-ACP methyl ester carboxylesterase
MLRALKIPVLVISGGRDPWLSVSVKPGHSYRNTEYVHFPDGLHCPDVYGAAEGASVFNRARLLGGF